MVERKSFFDWTFDIFNLTLLTFLAMLFAYPMIHVLMASFSDPAKLLVHIGPLFKPTGFSLEGYKIVMKNPNVLSGTRIQLSMWSRALWLTSL